MITKFKINDMANTSTGYTFRGAIQPALNGNVFVLQAKNITQQAYVRDLENLVSTTLEMPRSNSYLKYNDVVLVSRGSGAGSFKSTVFKSKEKNAIASSSLIILRVKSNDILPEYLSLFLNSIDGQRLLSNILSGSQIKTILCKDLNDVRIPVPSIKKQEALIALYQNINRQERIAERQNQIKKTIFSTLIRNLITN